MRRPHSTIRTASPIEAGPEPRGYLHIAGDYAQSHRPEIEAVLRSEASRAHDMSPSSHVIAIDADIGSLLVSTTTEHLAQRLGRALVRAFGGQLHSGFGLRNELALVWWQHEPT